MKMRTVYIKTNDMDSSVNFWGGFLGQEPVKNSQYWSEFKCENINLGFLLMDDFKFEKDKSNSVPVFEVEDLSSAVQKCLGLGGEVILDQDSHPDKKSLVLSDNQGNEFEVTLFRDEV